MEAFKIQIAGKLSKVLGQTVQPFELETPPDRTMGDFAFPCFKLSKIERKAPPVIAKELADKVAPLIPTDQYTVKAVGPYVNFSLTDASVIQSILVPVLKSQTQFGSVASKSRDRWVFEFSSPNVAKPFQIYHLRTTIVGASLSKIAKHRGFDVITINHLGDWGTQYGKLAIALKKYESTLPKELTLKNLVDVYVQIHKDIDAEKAAFTASNPDAPAESAIEKAGQDSFLKLEQGDPEMRAIWLRCLEISLKEFKNTYARYQVDFDHYWGESHYESQLKPLLEKLKSEHIVKLDQGAWVVPVTSRAGHELPPCILEKSDGASIYATRDVAAAVYRYEQFKFDRMSYVVGKEQMMHFEQIFGVLRAMGCEWEKACEHIATGLYRFKDAKMSTRKGNFITLEEVSELCVAKSLALMLERNNQMESGNEQKLSEQELTLIAEQVAIGALVFADLSTDPSRDMEFDVERVISFDGETGPYLQYAHTRCASIIRKSGVALSEFTNLDPALLEKNLKKQEELFLLKQLGRFPEALERTLDQRKPSQLTSYLIDLTKDFGVFYRECKVVNPENPELTKARLALVEAARIVLSLGLDLLGIPKPAKM